MHYFWMSKGHSEPVILEWQISLIYSDMDHMSDLLKMLSYGDTVQKTDV